MTDKISLIQSIIYEIRGQKVMLDSDLARLYGVEVKRLNEGVKRNIKRFPPEFMFQLTEEEWKNQRSQFATFSNDTYKCHFYYSGQSHRKTSKSKNYWFSQRRFVIKLNNYKKSYLRSCPVAEEAIPGRSPLPPPPVALLVWAVFAVLSALSYVEESIYDV